MSGVTPDTPPTTPDIKKGVSNLAARVVAALVLAPLTILLAWLGGWLWACIVTVAGALLFVEWLTIVGARNSSTLAGGVSAIGIAGIFLAIVEVDFAIEILLAGTVLVAVLAAGRRLWAAGGLVYAAAAVVAAILVRLDPAYGFVALMFVLLVVWGADIGGYFAGRSIGGPKLWPRVSPNKTWAGAIGGLVLGLIVAAIFAFLGYGKLLPLLMFGAVVSVVSQLGDLFESAVKRRFDVKDSSQIIPGHGGLLDRLDGFVAAIVFAAVVGFLRGGLDGVGRGFMVW